MTERIAGVTYPPPDVAACSKTSGTWPSTTVGDALRATAARKPGTMALVAGGRRVDYREYDEATERLGAALLSCGLRPGDRIMFQMGNTIETAFTLLACFKAGLIPVCTLPQHRDLEIGTIARASEARGYVVQANASRTFDLVRFAREMLADCPTLHHLVVTGESTGDLPTIEGLIDNMPLDRARAILAEVAIDTEDVLVFQLSGGTTGTPKIIPRMHGEYLRYCQAWIALVGLEDQDAGLWALPLIHNAAMIYHLIPSLMQGRKLVLMERFEVVDFLSTIERERIAITGSIGPIAAMLLDYRDVAAHDLSSIKLFTTLSRADAIEAHLGVPVINVYGISEGVLTASHPRDPMEARHRTVGRPVSPLDEFRLYEAGSERQVAHGAVGELAFRGPSMIHAYYRGREDLLTADGFFRTGDLMRAHRIDGTDYFSFEGRIKDNIDRGGEKFGPEEVEDLIVRHPAIADAKVVAMPDPVYGEKACAFLIARRGMALPDIATLARFLEEQGLARFKVPERIEPIDSFPLTRVGKVDRPGLRSIIANKKTAEAALDLAE